MSDGWYIHRNDKAIGPLSADEIRHGLRAGDFDPFDLISREGSNLRRELVEVDELFVTSKIVYADGEGSLSAALGDLSATNKSVASRLGNTVSPGSGFVPAAAVINAAPGGKTAASNKPQALLLGQGHLALADQSVRSQFNGGQPLAMRAVRQRDPKHFLLMDARGHMLGPMSATEIQSLYYRGVLTGDVRIMRQGKPAQVSLSKFIAAFAGNQGGRQQGGHPVSGILRDLRPSGGRRHDAYHKQGARFSSLPALAVIGACALFVASGVMVLEHKTHALSALGAGLDRAWQAGFGPHGQAALPLLAPETKPKRKRHGSSDGRPSRVQRPKAPPASPPKGPVGPSSPAT